MNESDYDPLWLKHFQNWLEEAKNTIEIKNSGMISMLKIAYEKGFEKGYEKRLHLNYEEWNQK